MWPRNIHKPERNVYKILVAMGLFKAGLLILFALALTFPIAKANNDFDVFWQKREEEAKKAADDAYHPNPLEVVSHLNHHVHMALDDDSNRRHLTGAPAGCADANPIDKCWRCDPKWADNRKKLADCVLGFGKGATGGKAGEFYEVTDPSDDDPANPKPGTLRFGVTQDKPLWITFARDMVIKLKEELLLTSDKTIDGRGAEVRFENGAQITALKVKNVIIHGIHISGNKPGKGGMIKDSANHVSQRTGSDGDGITIFGSSNIWVDHVSLSSCTDGLIDCTQGSTAITISNCRFEKHDKTLLFSADDDHTHDKNMQVTVAFNQFGPGLVQRMPRVRHGFAHVVNNNYTQWEMYAIGGGADPTILSQGNRFDAGSCKEVTKRFGTESEWKSWNWKSQGDLFMNGAFFVESGSPDLKLDKTALAPKPGAEVEKLVQCPGALKCVVGQPC